MVDSHRLHESRIEGHSTDPAVAFAVEHVPAPEGVTVIALSGELDIAATGGLRDRLDALAGSRGVVLDLTRATFVDASMLHELVRAKAELARHGTPLVLAGAPPAVLRALELTRTRPLFTLAGDRAAGLALVARG